ncbi:hypothetical protein [Flavobacterium cerinum]|uniref:Uncharacterized protein n=1 Tax=Flavobacterium cerinum TaxID=2502784 RepID=A0A3S3SDR8_9FLAO|nr:hypothetical protein [Flavobacterium cerinum]RWW98885.1 hypothetical protein EPI11_13245 [Flavobacterium cerinum]
MKIYSYFLLFFLFGLLGCENSEQQTGLITSVVDCIVPEETVMKIDSVMESKVTVTPIVQLK